MARAVGHGRHEAHVLGDQGPVSSACYIVPSELRCFLGLPRNRVVHEHTQEGVGAQATMVPNLVLPLLDEMQRSHDTNVAFLVPLIPATQAASLLLNCQAL